MIVCKFWYMVYKQYSSVVSLASGDQCSMTLRCSLQWGEAVWQQCWRQPLQSFFSSTFLAFLLQQQQSPVFMFSCLTAVRQPSALVTFVYYINSIVGWKRDFCHWINWARMGMVNWLIWRKTRHGSLLADGKNTFHLFQLTTKLSVWLNCNFEERGGDQVDAASAMHLRPINSIGWSPIYCSPDNPP